MFEGISAHNGCQFLYSYLLAMALSHICLSIGKPAFHIIEE